MERLSIGVLGNPILQHSNTAFDFSLGSAFTSLCWSSHPLPDCLGPVKIGPFELDMKILLRNTKTGLLYVGPGQWTKNGPEAFDFQRTDVALDAVRDANMQSIEVLVRFENPFFDIPLTVVGSG